MWRLPSYLSGQCCSYARCHFGSKDEPCWGVVDVVAEEYAESDYWWIHACDGHWNTYEGGAYIKSDKPEDQGVEPIEDDE